MQQSDLVRVRMLKGMAGVDSSFRPGEFAWFPRDEAARMAAAGSVELVADVHKQDAKETHAKRGAPEKAIR